MLQWPQRARPRPESSHGAVRKRSLDESRQEALAHTSRRSRWSDVGERKKAHKLETLALLAGGVSANFANNTQFREFIDHISDGLIGVDRHRIPELANEISRDIDRAVIERVGISTPTRGRVAAGYYTITHDYGL